MIDKIRGRAAELKRRFARDARGVAAIEMALIFPMMMVLYFGMIDVTDLLAANRRVTVAASTVSDLVTQAPGTLTTADLNGFYEAVAPIIQPFPADNAGIEVFAYKKNGGSAQLRWQNNNGNSCGAAPSTSGLTDIMTEDNDIVIARVCITTEPITGKIVGSGDFTLTDQVALRPRQSLELLCSNC